MNILQALDDPQVFAQHFHKNPPSWEAWRSFLAALFALPMSEEELDRYQVCTGREGAPSQAATEAWLICGRRSGKSFTLSLIAVFLAAFKDWRPHLAVGERATVMVIAADRRQARVIMRYITGLLRAVPMLERLIESERNEAIDLNNRVTIEIHTASFKSVRGYSVAAALCDETSFWPSDESSAEPDTEILSALRPAMATIPGAIMLCASSPYAKRGALYQAFNRHWAKDDDPILVWRAPTRMMNPTVPEGLIAEALERDEPSARSEYLAEFRNDIETFISREQVAACVEAGVLERPPSYDIKYSAFIDPSGGSHDSMACCIGHQQGSIVIVDALREIRAPFDPESATEEVVQLLRRYRVKTVSGDKYAAEWCAQAFEKRGVNYQHAELPKSGLYLNLLPHLNSKTVKLLDLPRANNQIASLERRTARGGRDTIDHPQRGHDDLANAIAGFVYIGVRHSMARPAGYYCPILGRNVSFGEPDPYGVKANPQSRPDSATHLPDRKLDERFFKIIKGRPKIW